MARMFPVLQHYDRRKRDPRCPSAVPWEMLAPHERQALRNHSQTLERLAERGGLSAFEILCVINGSRWEDHADTPRDVDALLKAIDDFSSGRAGGEETAPRRGR